MKLTPEQHAALDRDGYLFFPALFSPAEMQPMLNAVPELYSRREPYNVREKDSDAVRTNFAAHLVSEPFARLCAVSNPIRRIKRPEFIAHREFAPIECLPDDCLLQGWAADLPWQSGMPATALETSSEPMAPARVAAQRACVALRE